MRCPICNRIYGGITLTHLRTHNHTFETFLKEYPKYYQYTPMAENDRCFSQNPENAKRKKEYRERMVQNG